MEHAGLNQTALGKKAGTAQSTIGRILKEKHAPDIDTLEALGKSLGTSAWQLLVPGMDPSNLPILQNASPEERELYERLKQAAILVSRKSP